MTGLLSSEISIFNAAHDTVSFCFFFKNRHHKRGFMKILVIAPSWVGDLVMAQSLLITLKKLHPEAVIHVLAPAWCLDIVRRMPEAEKGILMPIGHGSFDLRGRLRLGRELREEHYDVAYILPNSWKSALIPFFARIKIRVGWKGEMRYGLLNSMRKNKKDFPRLIARYSALAWPLDKVKKQEDLEFLSYPRLRVEPVDPAVLLNKFGIKEGVLPLGLCPGAEFGPAKKWPPEYYAALAKKYLSLNPARECWIFGSGKDRETGETIRGLTGEEYQSRVRVLAGSTTLEDAIDLLAMCSLVISNDSGLMHVGAAVGVRLAAVFGSTSTVYTPPSQDDALLIESDMSCHPCFKRVCPRGNPECLTSLLPELVWDRLIKKWPDLGVSEKAAGES